MRKESMKWRVVQFRIPPYCTAWSKPTWEDDPPAQKNKSGNSGRGWSETSMVFHVIRSDRKKTQYGKPCINIDFQMNMVGMFDFKLGILQGLDQMNHVLDGK